MIVCIPPGRGIPGGISRSATKGAPAAARTLQMGPGRGHYAARSGPVALTRATAPGPGGFIKT